MGIAHYHAYSSLRSPSVLDMPGDLMHDILGYPDVLDHLVFEHDGLLGQGLVPCLLHLFCGGRFASCLLTSH